MPAQFTQSELTTIRLLALTALDNDPSPAIQRLLAPILAKTDDDPFDLAGVAEICCANNPHSKIAAIKEYRHTIMDRDGYYPDLLEAKQAIEAANPRW